MNRSLLDTLLMTPTVSGCEEEGQKKVAAYAVDFADIIKTDMTGNLVCGINPKSDVQVMLCGHMDEIGFRVTQLQENGFLRVQKAGGVRAGLYLGSAMQILHTDENGDVQKVDGVVVVTSDLLKKDNVSDSDLILDIGASSKADAEKVVAVGDPVCADTTVHSLLNQRISSRALDDKTGAYVVVEAVKKAKEMGCKIGASALTSVGEETTGRGAYVGAAAARPSCAFIVDVTWASDCPGTDPGDTGLVELGKGPVICYSEMNNKALNKLLVDTAKENNIPVQFEVAGGRTFTDGDTMLKTGDGVPVTLLSIPLRYMHSSTEVADERDLAYAIDLLAAVLLKIDSTFDYRPFQI